jgi:cell division protein FtsW
VKALKAKQLPPPDPLLLGSVTVLMLFGVIMVASASLSISEVRYGDAYRIIGHWVAYIPLGFALIWWVSRIDTSWWKAISVPLLILTLVIMVLVLVPGLGKNLNGARRWFSLPLFTLQPVEFAKPVVVLYMAYYMAAFPERLRRFATGLAPMLIVLSLMLALLLLEPDFGNAALLTAVCVCMWFVGGVPIRHLVGIVATLAPLGVIAIVAEPYRLRRLLSFTDPWAHPYGSGYQLVQSMIAFGAGGVKGAGLGQGVQKLFYLPETFTDFIAAVIGEELGLIGTLTLVLLFSVLMWRCIRLSIQTQDMFSRLLVLGCSLLLGLAFIINMGAAMGILPTKGMPLPFVSYGGSALLGECLLIGLILAVQRHQPQNHRPGAHA